MKTKTVDGKPTSTRMSRRKLLKRAVAAGIAAGALVRRARPATAQAPVTLKMQSTWPTRDIFHEIFEDWARKVNEMAGGRLKVDVLPAGAVVPSFEVIEAVSRGTLDGGHGVPAYWFGRDRAASLFGTGPSFGLDAEGLLAWIHYGGGQALYNELIQNVLKLNVVSFFHGPMPTQPLGWFSKEVKGPNDLKNLRYRTVGLSANLFGEMGAAVKILPGGEIIPSMERGVLDAAEFNNTTSDKLLGFPDVRKICMVQSYHQPVEFLELLVNRKRYEALPNDLQAIIKYATMAQSADFTWKFYDRNSADMLELEEKRGVKFVLTPKSVLQAQLSAWDRIVATEGAKNPFFAKVLKSQQEWAARTVPWRQRIMVENETAFEHYFKRKA